LPPWEQRVLAAAALASLGPAISQRDPVCGIVVTEWVRGRGWTRAQAAHSASTARIATLVRRIQALALSPPHYAQQPVDWIRHYSRIASRKGGVPRGFADELAGAAARRLDLLARLPTRAAVLSHSDLHRFNLIDGRKGLVVLDWEYAHFSDPYWDLAGWLSANDLGVAHRDRLLARYLGRVPRRAEIQRLAHLIWLYDYVCLLWSNAHRADFAEPAGAAVARRARVLAARLIVVEPP